MPSKTGKVSHDEEIGRAFGVAQSAARAAGASQATVRAAEIISYRAALASARANGVEQGVFQDALWQLGVRDP